MYRNEKEEHDLGDKAETRVKSVYMEDQLIRRVELLMREQGRRSFSETVCVLLDKHPALPPLQGPALRTLLKERRLRNLVPNNVTVLHRRCPSCNSADHFVRFPNGRWRCGICLAVGDDAA